MKIRMWYRGNTVGSQYEDEMPVEDLGFTPEEWDGLSENDKSHIILDWAWSHGLEYGWEELND